MPQVLLDDFEAILAPQLGTWAVRKGRETPTPDKQVVLLERPAAPIWGMGPIRIKRAGVQVLMRGDIRAYAAARAQLELIRNALDLFSGTVNGTLYIDVRAMSSVMPMGWDDLDRPRLAQNFDVTWSY